MIKVIDIMYVRFRAPDLETMKNFLLGFGLLESAATDEALYMRGYGSDFCCHITEKGEAEFVGLALEAGSEKDLHDLAASENLKVEERAEPGGGKRVALRDPDGFLVEVVHGIKKLPEQDIAIASRHNMDGHYGRFNERIAKHQGPSHVRRLGHCVLGVKDYQKSGAWYRARFGLLVSDEVFLVDENDVIGAFMRCDRGDMPVDHHTIFLAGLGESKFNHAAFEVENIDDLMRGRAALEEINAQKVWGVGRHILGSQVFDYWRDPWGHMIEHWTDGDLFDASKAPSRQPATELLGTIWGPPPPPDMG